MTSSDSTTVLVKAPSQYAVPLINEKPDVIHSDMFDCFVCNTILHSKMWKSHVTEFPHADLLKLKRQLLRQGYKEDLYNLYQGKFIYCYICRVVLQSTCSVKSHCQSAGHQTKFKNWPTANLNDLPDFVTKLYFCSVCNKNLDGTSDSYNHYSTHKRVESVNSDTFDCLICKTILNSKSWKESHVKEFPHADLLKLKRELMKQGYKEDLYALHQDKYIYCHICRVVLQCPSSVKSHCQSVGHRTKFKNWPTPTSKDLPESVTKCFFCNICNKNLDGTSDSWNHYTTHQRPVMFNTARFKFPELSLINTTVVKEIPIEGTSSNKLNQSASAKTSCISNSASAETRSDAILKEQICVELDKLVQTLYYSGKVRLEVALEILRKVNRDVGNIIRNTDAAKELKLDHRNADETTTVDLVSGKTTKEAQADVIYLPIIYDDAVTISNETNELNSVVPGDKKTTADSVSEKTFKEGETKHIEKPKYPDIKQKDASPQQSKTIDDLIIKIIQETLKQEGSGTDLQLDVLNEIDSLLWQLKQENLPLLEVLNYLKAFNVCVEEVANYSEDHKTDDNAQGSVV